LDYPEGATPLDPDEMQGLRFSHIQTREDLNQMEQVNIQDGLIWLSRQKKPDVLSEAFVRELHRQLYGNVWIWAGEFRQTEKNFGVAPGRMGIDLRNLLDDTRYWISHKTYLPYEIALRFHHRLVQIHMFPNGNGRHARIITDALTKYALNTQSIAWGGQGIDMPGQHRKEYIAALRAADAGNIQPLIDKFS
jgi:Fic-DOC domain mobile mystery protein B